MWVYCQAQISGMENTPFTEEEEAEGRRCFQYLVENGLDNAAIIKRFDTIAEKYDKVQLTYNNIKILAL